MKKLKSILAAKVAALRALMAVFGLARCNTGCKGCNTPSRGFFGWMTFAKTPVLVGVNESGAEVGHIAAINEALAPTEEWTRIAPYRAIPNEVGLQVFDRAGADAMVSAFNSLAGKVTRLFRGLPAFVGHPDDPKWAKENPQIVAKYGSEAYGRIKALEAREDGLYGKVAFNEDGKRLVSGDAAPFAFHSPRWGMLPATHQGRKAFRPVLLHSIGLTNNPNISDNTIGLNEAVPDQFSPTMKIKIIALLAALGRPIAADSTDEQLAAAVNEATPVATALVTANNELATLKPQLTTAQNELVTVKGKLTTTEALLATEKTNASNERAARADAVLTVAVNEGRITEAQRADWKTKLVGATDFAAVQGEIVKLKPAVNTRKLPGIGNRKEEVAASNDMITAINTAVTKHIKDNGLDPVKDYTRAYEAVRKTQPQLFTATA